AFTSAVIRSSCVLPPSSVDSANVLLHYANIFLHLRTNPWTYLWHSLARKRSPTRTRWLTSTCRSPPPRSAPPLRRSRPLSPCPSSSSPSSAASRETPCTTGSTPSPAPPNSPPPPPPPPAHRTRTGSRRHS